MAEPSPISERDAAGFEPLPVGQLTWAALLGQWVDFARSAVALPTDAEGQRRRSAVPDMIQLQAVWFALESWEALATEEQALALDRAEVLVDRHAGRLRSAWGKGGRGGRGGRGGSIRDCPMRSAS